jgi:hypothetical protein
MDDYVKPIGSRYLVDLGDRSSKLKVFIDSIVSSTIYIRLEENLEAKLKYIEFLGINRVF